MKSIDKITSTIIMQLDGDWLLATDPYNIGREQKWFTSPVKDAKLTKVPWIIQDAFPGYHGVAWYWREFVPIINPHVEGHYLLRFWAVDYKADVWLNNKNIGSHEGGETPC
jgi:beta-glucuronidase